MNAIVLTALLASAQITNSAEWRMALEGYEAWDTFEDRFQVHLAFEDGWAYLKAARITYRQGEPVTNGHWWAGRYSVETGATGKVRVRFKKRKARRRWRFEK